MTDDARGELANQIDGANKKLIRQTCDTSHWSELDKTQKELADLLWVNKEAIVSYLRRPTRASPARGDAKSVEAWIEAQFSGHGVAVRRETDATIPGEPFMSMDTAKEIVRRALVPPPAGRISDLTKLADECHQAKWQFDLSEDYQPSKAAARGLIKKAFEELHRIGDLAMKMCDETHTAAKE